MAVKYQVYISIEGQDDSKIDTPEDDCWNENEVVLKTFDNLDEAEAFIGTCQQVAKEKP